MTALVLVYLSIAFASESTAWELIAKKAEKWLKLHNKLAYVEAARKFFADNKVTNQT
jgi:hypothetical protein